MVPKMKEDVMKEGVVLLHGILRSNRSMRRLAERLEKEGYAVLNVNYHSRKFDILAITQNIMPQVQSFAKSVSQINFVGHSMGGLIIRMLLSKHKFSNLGRVVMLGTPNSGSEIADFLKHNWMYKKIFGPAGQQLITNQAELQSHFGKVNYELGIIAGKSRLYFLANFIFRQAHDGRVSVASTRLGGLKEHLVLDVGHSLLPLNAQVIVHTLHFLKHGTFAKAM